MNSFKEAILPHLVTGENVTAIWAPRGGRRKAMLCLAQNSAKFGFHKLAKYKIFYLDHNELTDETPEAYFKLFLKNLDAGRLPKKTEEREILFSQLSEKVEKITQKGYHLIFILGRFDELNFPLFFFNNLSNLFQIGKPKVHFIFAVSRNIFTEENLQRYGQLRELICQNQVYFPLFSSRDALLVAGALNKKYGYQVPLKKQKLAAKLSGGHATLIKACLKVFHEYPKLKEKELLPFLSQRLEVKIIFEDIWNNLLEPERACLSLVAHGSFPKNQKPDNYLVDLKIVTSRGGFALKCFSPLFEAFLKSQKEEAQTLSLDSKTGEILVNSFPSREKLTLQEYHLLVAFLKKPKVVISRDEIADILWGKKSCEKYSDWAIDQIISQLRKRLEQMAVSPKKLQTIRDRGYRWLD